MTRQMINMYHQDGTLLGERELGNGWPDNYEPFYASLHGVWIYKAKGASTVTVKKEDLPSAIKMTILLLGNQS